MVTVSMNLQFSWFHILHIFSVTVN